jgi:uncharacterized protein with GYD domain
LAKYLVAATYSAEGFKGLIKESAKSREAAVTKMAASVGGKVESVNWALGDTDVYVICDLPDSVSAAAISMLASASGAVKTRTTPLLSASEVDEAIGKGATYRAPGAKSKK